MLMARIGGFVGNRTDVGFEDDIDNIAQRDVVMMRSLVIAPAQMDSDLLRRNSGERVMSASTCIAAIFLNSAKVLSL
jgi:hypothetical protein